jgi:hypothetical protein
MPQPATDHRELLDRAESLAVAWGVPATAATSVGQERALLRLFGVAGLDRAGRPLAGEVVDRYLAPDPSRLAGGIGLPFTMGLVEYDLAPQELALEVAAGTVDLGAEAELLMEPDRRAVAEAELERLARGAWDRVDANRVARRELLDLLGDAEMPWLGSSLQEPALADALDEAADGVAAGLDLLRIEIPVGRELADRLADAGLEVEGWRPRPRSLTTPRDLDASEEVPTGSQRALAVLRRSIDESAAGRRSYVRLATEAPALAAPEQAVVAAFERVDIVFADAMAEIVSGRIDPDRALADHAFAHRLLARAGAGIVVGAGPLVVAPDLESGVPSDPATRAGRAVALQLLGVALARRNGIEAERIIVGAVPDWIAGEPGGLAMAAGEVSLRRSLFPGHPLGFVEPPGDERAGARWAALVAALMPHIGAVGMILRRPGPGLGRRALATRMADEVARGLARSRTVGPFTGEAADHALRAAAVAERTLERLSTHGWRAILGSGIEVDPAHRLGADAVAERTTAFDMFRVRPPVS